MRKYVYNGQAFGVDADITDPGPYKLYQHGKCGLTDGKPGQLSCQHEGFNMPGGLSHGPCVTSVNAMPEDRDGFFRSEVRATVVNVRVEGKSLLSVDRITVGLISVFRRQWFDRPGFHARRTRVLPLDCSLVNLTLDGAPLDAPLPAPFNYSADQREAYLTADEPDAAIDAEVRQAIIDTPSRTIYIPNFGRIFFGEWTLVPSENFHPLHQIAMLRMAFSSPPSGAATAGEAQGGGDPDGGVDNGFSIRHRSEAGGAILEAMKREQGRKKLIEDPTSIPDRVRTDNVHFTLTGPRVLPADFSFELNFWAHLARQRQDVIEYAKEAARVGDPDLAVKTEGPFLVQRGTRISVRLKVDGLTCRNSHKWLMWTGEIGRATFVLEVPTDATRGTHVGSASIRLNGCQIATMSFVLHIGEPRFDNTVLESHLTSHRRGFASYASDDRGDVLARVQGMEAAYKGLKVFVDVIDLRSGQYWEAEITKRIKEADVFYLFWCRHAISSEWVGKEWRHALTLKGLDFIDPIPLEGPQHAIPPSELAGKHFNDPLLLSLIASGRTHS